MSFINISFFCYMISPFQEETCEEKLRRVQLALDQERQARLHLQHKCHQQQMQLNHCELTIGTLAYALHHLRHIDRFHREALLNGRLLHIANFMRQALKLLQRFWYVSTERLNAFRERHANGALYFAENLMRRIGHPLDENTWEPTFIREVVASVRPVLHGSEGMILELLAVTEEILMLGPR